jgi:D-alanyl-D-alanine carboxypeptidase
MRTDGLPEIVAAGGILVDLDARRVLWERASHVPRPPASTTKILSTLVALNNFPGDQVLTVSPEALGQEADETRLGMLPGQTFRVNELLAAMMLVSANDAANTVAVSTVGMPRFVAAMNEQVEALHLHESHFTTPVGLDDPGQYTSPYDLAVITAVAYEGHKEFRDLAGARHMILPPPARPAEHQPPARDLPRGAGRKARLHLECRTVPGVDGGSRQPPVPGGADERTEHVPADAGPCGLGLHPVRAAVAHSAPATTPGCKGAGAAAPAQTLIDKLTVRLSSFIL